MKTHFEKSRDSRRANCPETNSWPLGHAIWLAVLLAHLGLATVHAAPEVVAWGYNGLGQTDVPSGLSNVVAIAAGGDYYTGGHSLALTAEGRVVAWGANGSGQTNVPSGLSNVVAIAAGRGSHSLALTAEGRVVGWGANWSGQTNVPSGLSNVVAIAAGLGFSLALTADGRVVAWGYNDEGQTTAPSGLSNVVAIAAGEYHSLALTAAGRVVPWGSNYEGQTNVPSGLSNVVAIAAGYVHNLALRGLPPGVAAPALVGPRFLVATADRPFHHRIMVKNGADAYGAAGLPAGLALDPNTGLITGLPSQAGTYSVVLSATNSVGSSAWTVTLFVNEPAAPGIPGGLVLGGLGSEFSYAVPIYNEPEWCAASGLPAGLAFDAQTGMISGVPVELGDFVVSLVASNRYGLGTGLLTIRVSPVVAWGRDYYGQTDVPSGLSNVVAIAAGESHSLALTAEGRVVAWGYNGSGQTNVPSGLSNVVAIAAGEYHSLALTAEGRVVGWGNNWAGQTNVPSGLSNVVAIAAGYGHSLALTAESRVVAWGANWLGQADVLSGLSNVVAIAAGYVHSLALTAEGRVVAWGGNNYYGETTVPSGLSNVVAIAAGGEYDFFVGYSGHSLALTAEGRVVAWGGNWSGQADVPSGLSNVIAIAAREDHSLALTAEGRVLAWDWSGQTAVPSGLSNVVAIAAGGWQNLALLRQPTVPTPRLELSRGMSGLELQAHGAPGISCQLLRASRLPGPWLPTQPVTFTNIVQLLRAPDASEPAQFFRLLRK